MSEPGGAGREWRFYVRDMLGFGEKVLAYTEGLNQAAFLANPLAYDATLRNLELIGEAAARVPEEVRRIHPGVPWRQIIATRNQLIHGYLGIDDNIVWSIITDDLPSLLTELRKIAPEE